MITNKDIRVENGFLIINGDKFPLDGQSPETIMEIVENNSDTTPTENSTAPITSGGVFTVLAGKADILTAASDGTTQNIEVGASPTNRIFILAVGYSSHYTVGIVIINSDSTVTYNVVSSKAMTATVSFTNGVLSITFDNNPYSTARLIRFS